MTHSGNAPRAVEVAMARSAARVAEIAAHPEKLLPLGTTLARIAAAKPNTVAVWFEGEQLTWDALHKRSNRIARGLSAKGVKQGDFVTIALPNGLGFIEACYAVWKIGAIPQPVSSRLPQSEMRAIADLANGPVAIGAPFDIGRPSFDIAALLAASDDDSDLPDIIAPYWKAPTSGGSTGRPKLIVAGSPSVSTGAMAIVWRLSADDIALMPGPLYHNGPFITAFTALDEGATLVLMPRFDAEKTLALIDRFKATWIYTVPTMMGRIWRLPDEVKAKYDVSSLKTLWHLAAPCPPWLKEAWIGWLGPDVIWELYGGTEGVASTVLDGHEWLEHRGSVGRVFGTSEIAAFAPDGTRLPPGETGEVFMRRAEGTPPTYHYLGAETRAMEGGWESIGDIGWLDAEGYLYLADRRTDMILVGGANVYPAEVEAAIDDHPLVQSSCVIGLPDEDLGNKVHAIVQAKPGLTEEALLAHLAEHLVVYKRPRTIEFTNEALRDDAGKVRRSQLREERIAAQKKA
ncbi:Bile acid-coenzyme A ligase [Alphaproteobacteria bacterium SO-S41]|nr:Bile acid-coenzyme A ligase [Alphaproteobacteria bacterium SO-S41]